MTAVSPAQVLSRVTRAKHIIDVLIEERAPKLSASPAWPLVRPLLQRLWANQVIAYNRLPDGDIDRFLF